MKSLLAAAISLGLTSPLLAAEPAAINGQRLSDLVRTLSSDEFQGRGPATPGEEQTVAFIAEQFADAGLEPGGDLKDGQRAWTQAVPLSRAQIVGTPELQRPS